MMTPLTMLAAATAVFLCAILTPAFAVEPPCGDVNETGTVTSVDALLVLKDAVGQPVNLACPAFATLPVCGNTNSEVGEECDGLDLNSQTCQSAGFSYGTLACDACALDMTGCTDDRYQDNGNGTVTDHETNLMWEQKTGSATVYNIANACPGGPNCGDPHHADNIFSVSTGSPFNPDGTASTSLLAALNGSSPFAGHDDWRLPTITELEGIVDLSATDCGVGSPCIDPVFGPTQSYYYWTSSTYRDSPGFAWDVYFLYGNSGARDKTGLTYVRAVRDAS